MPSKQASVYCPNRSNNGLSLLCLRSSQVHKRFQVKLLPVAQRMARPRETLSRIDGDSIVVNRYSWPRYKTPRLIRTPDPPTVPNLMNRFRKIHPMSRELCSTSIYLI